MAELSEGSASPCVSDDIKLNTSTLDRAYGPYTALRQGEFATEEELFKACLENNGAAIESIFKRKRIRDEKTIRKALSIASKLEHTDAATQLIKAMEMNELIDFDPHQNLSMLEQAICTQNWVEASCLLGLVEDPSLWDSIQMRESRGESTLLTCATYRDNGYGSHQTEVIRKLMENGLNCNPKKLDSIYGYPLGNAIRACSKPIFEELLKKGAQVDLEFVDHDRAFFATVREMKMWHKENRRRLEKRKFRGHTESYGQHYMKKQRTLDLS
ncbi:hypothetical protein GQ44DRAFT_779459 [Phaeosphaeriaceae sp. PMI808]|nr:hypothetical protein GQ44DRAFT_779459 [Phaeosphaeriaceae sp. PMI808]